MYSRVLPVAILMMVCGVSVGCGGDSGAPTAGAPEAPAPTSSEYNAYSNGGQGGPSGHAVEAPK